MSVIEKMSIMGIRSFGPDDQHKQLIEFFRPLTLILGPNGSGKTTIIECLRYMTTGDTPPNSDRGCSFVHDPKLAGETEVKGQVKLQFKDVLDKRIIATRNLVATQKQKKIHLKTLEGVITRYAANGDKTTLSSKCAELDKEMITALGVSKAILNNVIFCHQEESNWPLSEGKALKQKFDEIFAATRYIKALDEIRKIRLAKMNEMKVHRAEAGHLEENKRKADEFTANLEKTETRLAACKDSVGTIEEKLKPVMERLNEITIKEHKAGKMQAELESCNKLLEKLRKDENSIRNSIEHLFMGTKDELKVEMKNFDVAVSHKKKQLENLKKKVHHIEVEHGKLMQTRSKLLEELGKLKNENMQHKERVSTRDTKLAQLNNQLGFGEISIDDDEPLKDSQVQSFVRNWQQKISMSQQQLKEVKGTFEAKETALQLRLDEVNDTKSKKTQEQKSSSEKIAKNKNVIRNIDVELSQANSLAVRQDDLKQDLIDAEDALNSLQSRVDVNEIRSKISANQSRKKEMEMKLSRLNQEMGQLQKESKLRAEIDLTRKDIDAKQDAVQRLVQRHKDTVIHLVGNMPNKNAQDGVKSFINSLNQDIQNLNSTLEEQRSQFSSYRTRKSFHNEELKKKEELLAMHKNKLFEVCGNQNFDEGIESLERTIKELHDETGAISGSLHLFNKYIEKLSISKPCCPLCSRAFPNIEEAKSLRKELQTKLQLVPSQLSKKEKLISEHQKRLNGMLELKPLKQDVSNLSENEIPDLSKKIKEVSDRIDKLSLDISESDDVLESKQCDLKAATDMLPDLAMLDQNQRELERLERRMSTLTCQLGTSDVSRTAQLVSEEINSLQLQIESEKNSIEANQQRISEHNEHVQQLRSQINDLRSEQVEISGRLQKKNSLEEQLNSLRAENLELTESIKTIKTDLAVLEKTVINLTAEKKELLRNKESELEKIRNKIKAEEKEIGFVNDLTSEIDRYIREKKAEELENHESKISSLKQEIAQKVEEITRLHKDEKELEKVITTQQLKYREYEDNAKVLEMQEEISSLQIQCSKLEKEIGDFHIKRFLSEKRQLIDQEKQMTEERNKLEGRQTELKNQVQHLKTQLEDKIFKNAKARHYEVLIQLRTTELACDDLNKYYIALDRAIMQYHKMKMNEINKIVRDLWIKTYAGNDIDYIEIRSNEDESEAGLEKSKRVYNYKVVLVKGDTAVDMRGRCSAGQKVLASLLIRLALAEVFCLNCGILALDEPTTNLDRENICSLAHALVEIVQSRSEQRNFQLIIITHDEDFIDLLGRSETVDYFYKVSKDSNACSKVMKSRISEMVA